MQVDIISSILGTTPSTLLATGLALFLIAYFAFKSKNLPPGPVGLPYFGYWPFIRNNDCHLQLENFKKKYGDIFSFTCTGRLCINLGSHKAVREACITKSEFFGDRAAGYNILNRFFKDGVLGINGETWKVSRKFFLVLLKERGANTLKTSLAGPLYDSIKTTMNELKARKGEPLNLVEFLTQGCCTFLRFTLFGEIGITDEQLRKFNELYVIEVTALYPKSILLSGTFAKYFIFPFMPNFLPALKAHREREKFVQAIIDEHKTTYDPENPRDIIDEYFKERDKRRSRGDPTAEYFTDKVLRGTLMQIMGDGALVVASFTSLIMKGLLLYPDEQDKLYNEIVEVIGLDRQPTIEDKSKLTYFNAYVQESMRMQEFFNSFPTQECKRETTLGGYRIPKGAILIQNFYSSHIDPEVYEEPEKFNPSRYILTDGKRKAEPPIMFGIGKRSCIGESFVMTQAFLLLATLIQNFHLKLAGESKISVESFVTSKLLVCAKPREKH
ncbi:cytochrome P450 2J1-like [Argiope bruennichi]|uniref:Cytochrome P450 2J1 like protein n=1 Tax=Argiope bruennichi TaxID=94029 RepID=A0A8T0E3A6_ARGBR|nr:cytochrome P450 2J1-like [Argiope bruennichi]XP_055943483.1 cytochrome P450 2J1-like [Argiope bruennichi]XP_055943488.1 cytochrome P450 2J1-like [Argiope bruennichi]KAF8764665.1 Cytochrome P450 2J1 like protein [Argiope bruennichi]